MTTSLLFPGRGGEEGEAIEWEARKARPGISPAQQCEAQTAAIRVP